ncbi:hypothetical protein [Zunongwangia endophytica]|uniref:Uncharacterized protein n=1 Tax=Zunongwangia endophytica TaxID=1808945 RepID=A0ABV8HC10_9FLAO|nr:hypothetical protein [Zunongwangia endophytica]MDN3593434.1 hypothetical protein [Zunongwangia endophytica]
MRQFQILNTTGTLYREQLLHLRTIMDESRFQEELFIPGGLFKKSIP